MEMTIDKAIPKIQFVRNALNDDMEIAKAYDLAIETMRKYQMFQDQSLSLYMERLKADMEGILTDLKNKIIDKSWNIDMYDDDLDFECCYLNDIDEVIQQKINVLRGNTDA